MLDYIDNLRSICSALMASDFAVQDRLKSILQVSYELLGASSIVAYRFDRATGQLEIIAMPGVREREIMRGPTPEPIFAWEASEPDARQGLPGTVWLENSDQYQSHIGTLSETYPMPKRPKGRENFRDRELEKYGGKGDLALAKVCLYKGIGQTYDRVGQLFFNFHKENANEVTFNPAIRSAIWYIATIVRELLVQELYHEYEPSHAGSNPWSSTVQLLRMVDQEMTSRALSGRIPLRNLPPDYQSILEVLLQHRTLMLEGKEETDPLGLDSQSRVLHDKQQRLKRLIDVRAGRQEFPADEQFRNDLRDLMDEALSLEMCRCVCRAALACVETFGGQADVVRVLARRIGIRIAPLDLAAWDRPDLFWLDEESITGHCLATGKVFVCNNIKEKGSKKFRDRFSREYRVQEYKSLMVVPLTLRGGNRAVLRLMSSDRDCFLDRHTSAVQYNAFVASHGFHLLDSRRMRERISYGLSFFAQGQAVARHSSVEDLFREALRVLGGDYAILWSVDEVADASRLFEGGMYVPASDSLPAVILDKKQADEQTRLDGLTRRIYDCAREAEGLIVCVHVLATLRDTDSSTPEYVFQVFTRTDSLSGDEIDEPELEGHFPASGSAFAAFPQSKAGIPLSKNTSRQPHSQIGFAVKDRETERISGVVWIGFDELHELSWWEKLYVQGMSNYVAQALSALGLRLAIRSFVHMIPKTSSDTRDALELAEHRLRKDPLAAIPEAQEAIATALDSLYMVVRKSKEVTKLLNPEDPSISLIGGTLSDLLRHAWSIATSFGTASNSFSEGACPGFSQEATEHCSIVYSDGVDRNKDVGGIVYTVAINIMKNGIDYGANPHVAWVPAWNDEHRVLILANGGDPPPEDALRVPECAIRLEDENRKVGLPLVKKLLKLEGGKIRLLSLAEVKHSYQSRPDVVDNCRTFYEVLF